MPSLPDALAPLLDPSGHATERAIEERRERDIAAAKAWNDVFTAIGEKAEREGSGA